MLIVRDFLGVSETNLRTPLPESASLPADGFTPTHTLSVSFNGLFPPPLTAPSTDTNGQGRFEAYFHAAQQGIVVLDDMGNILEANKQAGVMFGYLHDSLPGVQILQLLDTSTWDQVNQAFIETQFSGNSFVETRIQKPDASSVPVEIIWNRVHLDGRTLFHGTISDLTDRNRALDESRKAIEEAERANEARLLFLATMSHEIRTPLNGIIGFAHLLSESELSDLQKQYVDMVGRSGDILLRIIDDILHLSRIESGRLELEEVEFDPVNCIEEVFEMHANNSKLGKVDLLYEILDGVPPLVRGDVTRIRQILTNLVSNSIKFTEDGHILVRCAVQDGRFLAFSVRDTGIGFDGSKTENLFQPFVQEDSTTTQKFGGTGLGLAICRKLVTRMGGYIDARSQPGEGAEFWFGIPLLQGTGAPPTSKPLTGQRALLVGGKNFESSLLCKRMARTGLETHSECTASKALALLKSNHFPLIIVSADGGGLTIEEFARKALRTKHNRDSKLLLLTPSRSPLGLESAAAWGYSSILTTPFRHADLESTLLPLFSTSTNDPADAFGEVASTPASPAAPPAPATPSGKQPFILIAEDNHINAQLALLVTKRLGFQAHVARNGREVLAYLSSDQSYTAILMDMRMPGMDGIEATRRIRLGHAGIPVTHIPIYALTANAMDSDRNACISAGMNGYFTKPLRVNEIRDALEEHGLLPSSA